MGRAADVSELWGLVSKPLPFGYNNNNSKYKSNALNPSIIHNEA